MLNKKQLYKNSYFDTLIKECKKESRGIRVKMFIDSFCSWLIVVSVSLLLVYCLIY